MPEQLALTGNEAVAHAMRQINPDVVAAYPITPQTSMMQKFADFVADGLVDSELVLVESEHSAMSATVGSQASGARSMTATAACGLALMWEILGIASAYRLPIVMPVVNRALSGPINIQGDHSDSMGTRDCGWIHIFSENAQEAYENTIMAMRIAEHPDVLTPAMVCLDGFIISHGVESVTIYKDNLVKKFVGEYQPHYTLLDAKHPITLGAMDFSDFYFEHKVSQLDGYNNSHSVILDVGSEFKKTFGGGECYEFFEAHKMDDAEYAVVVLGSTAGSTRMVVDDLRAQGVKAGMLKIRVFRPFPYEEIARLLAPLKGCAVLDRSIAYGGDGGPVHIEVRSALYGQSPVPVMLNYIYGLGGKPIEPEHIHSAFKDIQEAVATGNVKRRVGYLNLTE
ncbi:pyruvate ferredoxin oxidoreductase [candidate division LCP-89 bacterium B3_LCP]|uniref:Pyruvate ferredoxin oxidoreductase n=1 Tax=candidate division LCP-89 bacterium B3_LCP TaxID=2012998 RepID=A0A532V5Y6_UNCL8|nr:MAG: pyruvate ferredoxin oxidoreductase [candidate division LCP-89 bacterium B3_LCP]